MTSILGEGFRARKRGRGPGRPPPHNDPRPAAEALYRKTVAQRATALNERRAAAGALRKPRQLAALLLSMLRRASLGVNYQMVM